MCVDFRHLLFLVLCIFLLGYVGTVDAAECKKGETRCEPLLGDQLKYSQCMNLVCAKEVSKKDLEAQKKINQQKPVIKKPITAGEETCENGLRRCNSIRNNVAAYWLCMEETCNGDLREKDASCEVGKKQCVPKFDEYRLCMNLTCKNKPGVSVSCSEGELRCIGSFRSYWDCVHRECLGDVEDFAKKVKDSEKKGKEVRDGNFKGRKVITITGFEMRYDENGKMITPMMGVPKGLRYPPEGVRAEDWVMGQKPARTLMEPASAAFSCSGPDNNLRCKTNDISSCSCSRGGMPSRKKEFVYKYYTPDIFPNNELGKIRKINNQKEASIVAGKLLLESRYMAYRAAHGANQKDNARNRNKAVKQAKTPVKPVPRLPNTGEAKVSE